MKRNKLAIILFITYFLTYLFLINIIYVILQLLGFGSSDLVLPMLVYCDEGTYKYANRCLTGEEYFPILITDLIKSFIVILPGLAIAFFATKYTSMLKNKGPNK